MVENEVIGDLGDIRAVLWDLEMSEDIRQQLITLVDEKMEKYRGKEVIVND